MNLETTEKGSINSDCLPTFIPDKVNDIQYEDCSKSLEVKFDSDSDENSEEISWY